MNKEWSELNKTMQAQLKKKDTFEDEEEDWDREFNIEPTQRIDFKSLLALDKQRVTTKPQQFSSFQGDSSDGDDEACYVFVENDAEYRTAAEAFREILGEDDIELEE